MLPRVRVFVSLVGALLMAAPAAMAVERWPATRVGEGPNEIHIRQQLDAPTELRFQDEALQVVLTHLADLHTIPIVIDRRSLGEQRVDVAQTPITIDLNNITLRSALTIMLGGLGLDYVIRDEVLLITTPELATSSAPLCLFDVSMMAPAPEEMDALLATVQTYANRYSVQVSMYRNVLLVKGNQREQDDIAAFLAALYRAQIGAPPMPGQ